MVKIILPGSKKRHDPPEILEDQRQKRRKMDCGLKIECRKILRTLMTHEFGPIFNQPVDPVELGIPDYFSIISHPMDLGTVSKKLEGDMYLSVEEFAADIRLTFSNAMRYNPPKNIVHSMAKNMNAFYNRHWESLEAKLIETRKNVMQKGTSVNKRPNGTQDANKSCHRMPAKTSTASEENTSKKARAKNSCHSLPAKKSTSSESKTGIRIKKTEETNKASMGAEEKVSMTSEEKARLKKELLEALRGELTGPLRGFLRKYCLINSRKEKIESVFGAFSDDALWELKSAMKGSLGTSMEKGKEGRIRMQHEKEITESKKREEKFDIEARIRAARAAKEALVENAKSELQMKRDKERERVEKMKRTVVMDDNLTILRELEKLCQCSLAFYDSHGHEQFRSPLERFGLRLKQEYYGYENVDDDDAMLYDDLEDGEIF